MNKFYQHLKEEHKEVQSIIMQLTEMKSSASAKKEDLFQQLKTELLPHMKAEEIVFYHPLEQKKGTRELALEGEEEHHVAELVFQELEESKDQDHWSAKMKVLKDLVDHHIKEEEQELFPNAEKVFKSNDFDGIMMKFEEEKKRIKQSIH